jgi:hypothetical protein
METERGRCPVSLANAGHRPAPIRGRQSARRVPPGARGPPRGASVLSRGTSEVRLRTNGLT